MFLFFFWQKTDILYIRINEYFGQNFLLKIHFNIYTVYIYTLT